ncbi:hypothetical protein [Tatumella morbirosei]|uniref:hypothetical protein n=1 Tax=Tatumella morbirosei TaxID=642227 RepID=UPI00069A6064|nr:hypothetical protein [Tatumella morbirosei]
MGNEDKRIPFVFCRIKRAADFLGVTTEDLLTLAVTGKITLCLRLEGMFSRLHLVGSVPYLTKWFSSLDSDHSVMAMAKKISKHTSFSIDRISYDDESNDPIFNPLFSKTVYADGTVCDDTSDSFTGRAYGLWVPQLTVITEIINRGKADVSGQSLGVYEKEESAPSLFLIPMAKNYKDIPYLEEFEEEDNFEYKLDVVDIAENDLWITAAEVRRILSHNGDLCDMPNIYIRDSEPPRQKIVEKIHMNTERHAANREGLLKSAINLLSKYPEECRGGKKEISAEKWADCILKRKDEIPPLMITNRDVIINKLREALNGPKA